MPMESPPPASNATDQATYSKQPRPEHKGGRRSESAKTITTALMNAASIMEKADEQVLPAVYLFIGASLRVSLQQLGHLTAARAVVQAICSPLSGILGDKYDRTRIVAAGCYLWAVMTVMVGISTNVYEAMVWCAFNGLGLALVIPCISSLVADYHPVDMRGKAFGVMGLVSALGAMGATLFATNIGGRVYFGLAGWRLAFFAVAAVSAATGMLVQLFAQDPRHVASSLASHAKGMVAPSSAQQSLWSDIKALLALFASPDVQHVLQVKSFQIIILQGIVGTMPWMSMTFLTLWLQLIGFTDKQASTLVALFTLGCAVGSFLGGYLGDRASRAHPNHGRILVNQLSVLMGLPLCVLLLKGLPWPSTPGANQPDVFLEYIATLVPFGLLCSWCGSNNSAIFSEIVPEALRSKIFAFDRAFEGAIGACGLPLVGLAAEHLFGFDRNMETVATKSLRDDNAHALSNALVTCLVLPWTLCLLFFSGLHWTYPSDRRAAAGKRPDFNL